MLQNIISILSIRQCARSFKMSLCMMLCALSLIPRKSYAYDQYPDSSPQGSAITRQPLLASAPPAENPEFQSSQTPNTKVIVSVYSASQTTSSATPVIAAQPKGGQGSSVSTEEEQEREPLNRPAHSLPDESDDTRCSCAPSSCCAKNTGPVIITCPNCGVICESCGSGFKGCGTGVERCFSGIGECFGSCLEGCGDCCEKNRECLEGCGECFEGCAECVRACCGKEC